MAKKKTTFRKTPTKRMYYHFGFTIIHNGWVWYASDTQTVIKGEKGEGINTFRNRIRKFAQAEREKRRWKSDEELEKYMPKEG